MTKNYIIVLLLLLFTETLVAQKDKIREAEKELNSGNLQNAIAILKSIEYQVYNSKSEEKAQYYFIKGSSYLELADKKVDEGANLIIAAKSYKETIKIELESGKRKYSGQILLSYKSIKEKLEKAAVTDSKANKYIESGDERYEAYLLEPKDTINLYNSAVSYLNGNDLTNALKHFETLKNINYSGIGTNYFARNKTTKTEDNFHTDYDRELSIQAGTHDKARTEKRVSKRGEIYKNLALLYVQSGDKEKAKKVIWDARIKNPEDISLLLAEADIFLESKDYESYKKSVAMILKNNTMDAELIYNLGVLSSKAKNNEEAENFYLKAVKLDSNYLNAYINLSILKLNEIAVINDEMNKLGTSPGEMKKYDTLKSKRDTIYKNTIPYLQKAIEINPNDEETYQSLLSVYNALDMTTEYNELKTKSY